MISIIEHILKLDNWICMDFNCLLL